MERDAVLNLRVPSAVKIALRRAADDDHGRSVSAMATRVLSEWLIAHQYLRKKRSVTRPRSDTRR
jgi:hypothetical protein